MNGESPAEGGWGPWDFAPIFSALVALVLLILRFDLGILVTAVNIVAASFVYVRARAVGRLRVGRLALATAFVPVVFTLLTVVFFVLGGGGD